MSATPRTQNARCASERDGRPAEVVANIAICLVHQTNDLLDQQLKALEKRFVAHGGLRERMRKARVNYRNQHPKK